MAVNTTPEQVAGALDGMKSMLGADGYELVVAVEGGRIGLTIVAGPSACEECLVPKPLLSSIALSMLKDGGVVADSADVDLTYPTDGH